MSDRARLAGLIITSEPGKHLSVDSAIQMADFLIENDYSVGWVSRASALEDIAADIGNNVQSHWDVSDVMDFIYERISAIYDEATTKAEQND